MGHDMSLQVVDIDEGYAEATCEALCKAHTDKQRAHESRATGEGDGRELLLGDAGTANGLVDDWHDILLMGA